MSVLPIAVMLMAFAESASASVGVTPSGAPNGCAAAGIEKAATNKTQESSFIGSSLRHAPLVGCLLLAPGFVGLAVPKPGVDSPR